FGTRVPLSGAGANLGNSRSAVSYGVNTISYIALQPGTTYWYCAIGSNTYGPGFGAVVTFTTPPVLPQVTTNAASNLTSTTATINGGGSSGSATTTGRFTNSTTQP